MNIDNLKFRVWDTLRDCFYPNEHGELEWSLEETIREAADMDFIKDKMIIESCIGLKDKNGRLVFLGDVLSENGKLLEVCWSPSLASYMLDDYMYSEDGEYEGYGNLYTIHDTEIAEMEVVGNIHEGVKDVTGNSN